MSSLKTVRVGVTPRPTPVSLSVPPYVRGTPGLGSHPRRYFQTSILIGTRVPPYCILLFILCDNTCLSLVSSFLFRKEGRKTCSPGRDVKVTRDPRRLKRRPERGDSSPVNSCLDLPPFYTHSRVVRLLCNSRLRESDLVRTAQPPRRPSDHVDFAPVVHPPPPSLPTSTSVPVLVRPEISSAIPPNEGRTYLRHMSKSIFLYGSLNVKISD